MDNDPQHTGGDNRDANHGDTAELSATSAVTDAVGEAVVQFRLAHQPGDNHRVAATLKPSALNTLTDNTVPPSGTHPGHANQIELFCGRLSPLLTVWRRLHVEVDSMAPPGSLNLQTGFVQAPPVFNPATLRAIIDIEDLDPDFEFDHQHSVGRIDVLGFGSFTTVDTIVSSWDDQVEFMDAPPNIVNVNGEIYFLWDDDPGSVPPFVMIGFDAPPVTLPKVPDTSELAERFDSAYVGLQEPMMIHYDTDTAFVPHVESTNQQQVNRTANANKDVNSAPQFWVVHVTSGFQGPVGKELDPDNDPDSVYGVTAFYGTAGQSGGSIIHLETIRDMYRGHPGSMANLERFTAVHEVGHQFYIDEEEAGSTIMGASQGPDPFPQVREFSCTSLKMIRECQYPQAQ